MDTLLEAADHFHSLVKQKELNQSIFIFSSIVEGFNVISNTLETTNMFSEHQFKEKIERFLLQIAQYMEMGNFTKIAEMNQFSLLPQLKKLHQTISEEFGQTNANKIVKIGVFAEHNPLKFYPQPRVDAMVAESEKQQAKLFFFGSEDVDFTNEQIEADVCENGEWKRIKAPFPDVINNVSVGRNSRVERKLRRKLPFTSFHVGNKFTLPKRLVENKVLVELLVPFRVCTDKDIILDFLKENDKVVFKYLQSNRGENIYFITQKGNRYILLDQKKETILSQQAFHNWLEQVILREKSSFIVQRYIHTRTKNDEPYHIRAHVQKNGEGQWQLTHIYPRLGNKKSNLSNISTEGRVEDFHAFLLNEYGEKGEGYASYILDLSVEVAWQLDKLYGLALDELGIDFAIDETGRCWMHEANNGPQTAFHEEKRAVRTIAYAKYIAEKGIVHTLSSTRPEATKRGFVSRNSSLSFAQDHDKKRMGIFVGTISDDELTMACVKAAKHQGIELFQFRPEDIDYEEMLIRGYFYEVNEWKAFITPYPDVVFDRVKLRGTRKAQLYYEELEDIPFTNAWERSLHPRSEIYQNLMTNTNLKEAMPDFKLVTRPRDIIHFLETYSHALIKSEFKSGNQSISATDQRRFRLSNGVQETEYSEFRLSQMLKKQLEEDRYIVQADPTKGGNVQIHVHLIKNEHNGWDVISHFATFITVDSSKLKKVNISSYLADKYDEEHSSRIEEEMQQHALNAALTLQETYSDVPISEVAVVMVMDTDRQISLLDADPNGPTQYNDVVRYAEKIIKLGGFLAEDTHFTR